MLFQKQKCTNHNSNTGRDWCTYNEYYLFTNKLDYSKITH